MAIVLNNQKSTKGSPYAFYTLTLTPSNRTSGGVTINYTLKANLQYSNSSHGWGLTGKIQVGSTTKEFTIKGTEYWNGTTVHTITGSFTVSGLTTTQTSVTPYFTVESPHSGAGSLLSKTTCSALTIPYYTVPEQTPAPALADTSSIAVPYIYTSSGWVVATNDVL